VRALIILPGDAQRLTPFMDGGAINSPPEGHTQARLVLDRVCEFLVDQNSRPAVASTRQRGVRLWDGFTSNRMMTTAASALVTMAKTRERRILGMRSSRARRGL
jgi:hypothetical protein